MPGRDRILHARCAVVGGGPAGLMAGYLLARRGIDVAVLEKHGDFLRDFRGDTIHPSTLRLLDELGLLDDFLALPHQRTERIGVSIAGRIYNVADFRWLGSRIGYIAFVPQWDFLDFIADRARDWPGFRIEMNAQAVDLIEEDGRIRGVHAETPSGRLSVRADLVIAADGRRSQMRARSGLPVTDIGAPIDVLWLRLPRRPDDPPDSMGSVTRGAFLAMIARQDYWQCGYVIAKGSADRLRDAGIHAFRARLVQAAPIFTDRVDSIASFDEVKLLSVSVDRLETWARPGLLCIGDAAHAMSPIGGVGINLAIQDAVAAANLLAAPLSRGEPSIDHLRAVQRRRMFPTRVTQRIQVLAQNRILGPVLEGSGPLRAPLALRLLDRFPLLQRIPARLIGIGVRPEHIAA